MGNAPATGEGYLPRLVLIAVATVMALQATRVLASYVATLSEGVDPSVIAAIVLGAAIALVAAREVVRRTLARPPVEPAVGGLLLSRLALQLWEAPVARLILGGLAVACWTWLFGTLLRERGDAVALGVPAGMGIDLSIRIAFGTVDLPWMPGPAAHAATVLLVVVVALALRLAGRGKPTGRDGASGTGAFFALGPGLALYHMVSGNLGFAQVRLGLAYPLAASVLAVGLALGIAGWAAVVGGGLRPGRAEAAALGGIGLLNMWLSWRGGALSPLTLVAASSWNALAVCCVLSDRAPRQHLDAGRAGRGPGGPPTAAKKPGAASLSRRPMAGWRGSLSNSDTRIATGLACGVALQALLLGAYSYASGAPRVVALAAALLALGAVRASGPRTSRTPRPGRSAARPIAVPVVLLAAACAWSAAAWAGPRTAPSAGRTLTVMTYNIRAGFGADDAWSLERTARAIGAQRPDVVVLQEVSRGWTDKTGADEALLLSRRLGMPFVFGPASRDGLWGNMILSRLPVEESHILRYDEAVGRERGALGVRLGTPSGGVWVFGTHLDAPKRAGAVRLRQARELIGFIQGRSPALVLGDLNADPDDPALDALRAAGFRDPARSLGAVTPTSADGRRIDYVLAGPRIDVLTVRIPRSAASDHLPVVAEVRLLPEE